jgi:hypothetical protein
MRSTPQANSPSPELALEFAPPIHSGFILLNREWLKLPAKPSSAPVTLHHSPAFLQAPDYEALPYFWGGMNRLLPVSIILDPLEE